MNDFDTFVQLIKEYREGNFIRPPTDIEVEEWRADWAKWNQTRRDKELEFIRSNIIISNAAKAAGELSPNERQRLLKKT